MKALTATLMILVALAAAVACGEAEKATPETGYDYAKLVCVDREKLGDDSTWGEFRERARGNIKRMERVVPPPVMVDFHWSRLALLRASLELVAEKDSKAIANVYEIPLTMGFVTLSSTHESIIDGMGGEERGALAFAGCDL